MQESMNSLKQRITEIEKIEKTLAYEPNGKTQHFNINMDDKELDILLDALQTYKGVLRMRMQEELKRA